MSPKIALPRRQFLRNVALTGAALALESKLTGRAQSQPPAKTASYPYWRDGDWTQPTRAVRGVNLGAWLVLEKWMTPSLFAGSEASDEWTFSQTPGAREIIERHRQNWITEKEFAWVKAHGLDAVRLPIGYWSLETHAPYFSAIEHVDNAFAWAKKYDLQILLDLHGAPGSQNGMDHSGRSGALDWPQPENVAATLRSLEIIAERYGQHPNLWGVECLNEPKWDVPLDVLKNFYLQAYPRVRKYLPPDRAFVIHDGFRSFDWQGFMNGDKYQNVVLDTHIYQVYTEEDRQRAPQDQIKRALDRKGELDKIQSQLWTIVGEWSDALAWEAVKNLSPLERELTTRAYGAAQLLSYERTHGWFYWSLKHENPGEWNFQDMVERGVLPQNFGA